MKNPVLRRKPLSKFGSALRAKLETSAIFERNALPTFPTIILGDSHQNTNLKLLYVNIRAEVKI